MRSLLAKLCPILGLLLTGRRKVSLIAAVAPLVFASVAAAQYAPVRGTVWDANAHYVAFATIRVCTEPATGTPCTPLATIYSGNTGGTHWNPFQTDAFGNWQFFGAPGYYDIQVSGPGVVTTDYPYTLIPGPGSTLGFQVISYASTLTFNNALYSGWETTLTGNVASSSVTNAVTGNIADFIVCQDGTGGRTFAWPSNFSGALTIGSGASVCTNERFKYDGTYWQLSPNLNGQATVTGWTVTTPTINGGTINSASIVAGSQAGMITDTATHSAPTITSLTATSPGITPNSISKVPIVTAFSGSDLGAQLLAAVAAYSSSPFLFFIPSGAYTWSTPAAVDPVNVGILGAGIQATSINCTSTTFCLKADAYSDPTWNIVSNGIGGFTMSGNPFTNSQTGVQVGDAQDIKLHDIEVTGFEGSGSRGIYAYNHDGDFLERWHFDRIIVGNNTYGVQFNYDGNASSRSFAYGSMDLDCISLNIAGETCMDVEGGDIYSSAVRVVGDPTVGTTMIHVAASANAILFNNTYSIDAEGDGDGIVVGNGGTFTGYGTTNLEQINQNSIQSGTYTSGITATGTVGQTCLLSSFNNDNSGGMATLKLTGTNTIATGSALFMTAGGSASTATATSASVASGTATCSGTAAVATTLGGPTVWGGSASTGPQFRVVPGQYDQLPSDVGSWANYYGTSNSAQLFAPYAFDINTPNLGLGFMYNGPAGIGAPYLSMQLASPSNALHILACPYNDVVNRSNCSLAGTWDQNGNITTAGKLTLLNANATSSIDFDMTSGYTSANTGYHVFGYMLASDALTSNPLNLEFFQHGNATSTNQEEILQSGHYGTDYSAMLSLQTLGGTLNLGDGTVYIPSLGTGTNADFLCLSSAGQVLIQASACTISSLRYKPDYRPWQGDALAAIGKLQVGIFHLDEGNANPDKNASAPQIGLNAENVASVLPLAAIYEQDMKTPKSYRQEAIIAVLVDGMQEQQREIAQLQKALGVKAATAHRRFLGIF